MSPKDGKRDLAWFGAGMGVVVAAAGRWLLREGRKQDELTPVEDADQTPAALPASEGAVVRGEVVPAPVPPIDVPPPAPAPARDPWARPDEPPLAEALLDQGRARAEEVFEPEASDEWFVDTSVRLTPVVDVGPEWTSEIIETALPAEAPADHTALEPVVDPGVPGRRRFRRRRRRDATAVPGTLPAPVAEPLAEHLPPPPAPPLFADEEPELLIDPAAAVVDLPEDTDPATPADDEDVLVDPAAAVADELEDTFVRLPFLPAPVDEQPVDEQPVDEQPVDEQPVDEQPVADVPPPLVVPDTPAALVGPAPVPAAAAARIPVLEIVAGTAVTGLVAAAIAGGASWAVPALALLAVLAAGLWVVAHHPVVVFLGMAFVLGFAPGIQTPVVGISITFVLSVGLWVAMAFMPEARHRAGWPAVASGLLVAVSFFAFVGNPITVASFADFVRWAFATAAVYPLLVLPLAQLARVGRAFVWGCVLAAVVGIGFVVLDPSGDRLYTLSIFGYGPDTLNSRYVLGSNGAISRLTGTYVDPNLGGLVLAFGLVLALALLRGRQRVLASGVIVLAIALTLSRADAGSVAVAGILLVLFGGIGAKLRSRLIGLGVVAFLGLLAVPAVRERLTGSFGARDRGSSARWEAIEAMPEQLRGHWFFGRGFGAPELVDQTATAATNYVANAPLLAVYRGGVIVGIVFTLVMLAAAVSSWRLLRRQSFERACLGAGYLGLMLVAFQLDIPVITLTPAILCLALMLAFLGNADAVDEVKPRRRPRVADHAVPDAAREESLSRA